MSVILIALFSLVLSLGLPSMAATEPTASFAKLAQRLESGKPTTIVFLGGSLTWGANASDPNRTSWRALMGQYFQDKYPHTPIRCVDAAIGGTGSDLGLFRLQRDVLAYHPDLVFLEFTVNDGLYSAAKPTLVTYETIMRDLIGRHIPVMQVILALPNDYAKPDELSHLKRRTAHLKLSKAYHTPVADVVPGIQKLVGSGKVNVKAMWPFDGVHPGDMGYELYFDLIHPVLDQALVQGQICQRPAKPVFGELKHVSRVNAAQLDLPSHWEIAKTYRTSLWFDGLSSRWMDGVAAYSAPSHDTKSDAKFGTPLVVKFQGTLVGVFGEEDGKGLPFIAKVDGKTIAPRKNLSQKIGDIVAFKANTQRFGGGNNRLFFWRAISDDLPVGQHTLEVIPVIAQAQKGAQLRIGAICSAGPQ